MIDFLIIFISIWFLIGLHMIVKKHKLSYGPNYTIKILKELFPEATRINGGLNHGKYVTEDYLFDIDRGFYTSRITGESEFIKLTWEETFKQLKYESSRI